MKPTEYELKLQLLMNNVFIAIAAGKDVFEEGYAADVRNRALKAERALEALKNQLKEGER